jgi:raffinose synthase
MYPNLPAGATGRTVEPSPSLLPDEQILPGLPWQPGPGPGQKMLVLPANNPPVSESLFDLGPRPPFLRFMACYRPVSCWMKPAFGSAGSPLPRETQFVLMDLGGRYAALYPLVDGPVRCSLEEIAGRWKLRLETGDPQVVCPRTRALLLVEGDDVHRLVQEGAEAVAALAGTLRLRDRRRRPRAAELLGWCSWNAFYEKVNEKDLLAAVRQFAEHGVTPRFILLDGGWQQQREWLLEEFAADAEKFPRGLKALVDDLRGLGVSEFYAWQTFCGYWRGASPDLIGPENAEVRNFKIPGHLHSTLRGGAGKDFVDTMTESFYPENLHARTVILPRGSLGPLYDAFHRHLAAAGVTGVKIDAMTWMEALAAEGQGRVAAVRDMVRAAETSTESHFDGGLIFCSSCSNDVIYQTSSGAILRTAGDYLPADRASHGLHLVNNAMVALWTAPFLWSDWDMFQTGHEAGWFHAAARAISGGPVYLTDGLGQTDFALVRRLRLSDGSLPLCRTPAVPTTDSIFRDPSRGDGLLKVFAANVAGSVLGAFDCRAPSDDAKPQQDFFRASDIPSLREKPVVVWSEKSRTLAVLPPGGEIRIVCRPLEYEILTVADASSGLAVIGNVNLLNPGGAVGSCTRTASGSLGIRLRDGGTFVGWSRACPNLTADGEGIPLEWDPNSGRFAADLSAGRAWDLELTVAPDRHAAHWEGQFHGDPS